VCVKLHPPLDRIYINCQIDFKLLISAKNNNMDSLMDRITVDTNICNGKPTIRGKRISVQTILEFLSAGDSKDEILKQYPTLVQEDIDACLRFAADLMGHQYSIQAIA
jgi:uncharacterized protein (DUF433 family)